MSLKRKYDSDDAKKDEEKSSALERSEKPKVQMTEAEYDQFLITEKDGRFKRTGKWAGMYRRVAHECCDSECARKWTPTPIQCLTDDYHCPSCVLHHRNNVNRFDIERIKWTADVPNTFYVFSLVDPGRPKKNDGNDILIKFGRTQHEDPFKRYPTVELRNYRMKLLMNLRGKLITMTKIENWWKEKAEKHQWFVRFSDSNFHGQTECIQVDENTLQQLLEETKTMAVSMKK